jgi:hypothetical protein
VFKQRFKIDIQYVMTFIPMTQQNLKDASERVSQSPRRRGEEAKGNASLDDDNEGELRKKQYLESLLNRVRSMAKLQATEAMRTRKSYRGAP